MKNQPVHNKNNPQLFPHEREINIFDIVQILLAYKRLIVGLLIIGFAAGLCVGFIFYIETYKSEAQLLLDRPIYNDKDNSLMWQSQTKNIVGDSANAVIFSQDTLKSILNSEFNLEGKGSVKKSTLLRYYKTDDINDGIRILKSAICLNYSKQTSILTITGTDRSPEIAAYIVKSLIVQLRNFYNNQFSSTSKDEEKSIEIELKSAKIALESAKAKYYNFKQTNILLTPENENDRDRGTGIPSKLKFLEEKLKLDVEEKTSLYAKINNRYGNVMTLKTTNLSLITIISNPEVPGKPQPREALKKALFGGFLGVVFAGLSILLIELAKILKHKRRFEFNSQYLQ